MSLTIRSQWQPTQAEFDAFARISGDDNPIHVDPEFSARTAFGKTVSHGMLIYAKLWALLLSHRPNARQLRQNMMFPNPCFVGDIVDLSIMETKANVFVVKAVRRNNGDELLTGTAEVAQ